MTRAKGHLIKLSIIFLVIWLTFLILGYTINAQQIISNILFGIGVIMLCPFVFFFFQSKSLNKNSNVSSEDVANYLPPVVAQKIAKNKFLLTKRVNHLRHLYWLGFALVFAILFIGLASLLTFL